MFETTDNKREIALDYYKKVSMAINGFPSIKKESIYSSLVHKLNPENVLITDIISTNIYNKENQSDILNLYYSIACPNFKCNFIFDHPLDHYSFMLMLEIARQITIGVSHIFKNIPLGSVKNIIDRLRLKNYTFAELDYPLVVGCIDTIKKDKAIL